MENILILGAGFLQKPAIEAAKKLGFRAVVVDADERAICVPLADRFEKIDLKNREAIFKLALELQNDGGLSAIATAGTDFSTSVSYAGEKLRLHCHSFEAALNASDKTRMRSCFKKNDIPSPDFFSVTENDIASGSAASFAKTLGFPCVVKPVDNMGARGCRTVRSAGELETAAREAVASSRSKCAVIEQYMEGDEYSIDALVYDGTFTVTGFADRHIYFPPYFVEMGHTMPALIDEKKRAELIAVFALGAKALGLDCGAAKADIKYTKDGPMVGEIAARLSGGYMSGWTYPYASGCKLTEQMLLVACGKKPGYLEAHREAVPFSPPASCATMDAPYKLYEVFCNAVSAERAWISIPGRVKEIIDFNKMDKEGHEAFVKDVFPRAEAGDRVSFPRNNVEKCGNVISAASSRAKAVSAAEDACKKIVLRLEPGDAETDAFLSGVENESEQGFPPAAYSGNFTNPALPDFINLDTIDGEIAADVSVATAIPRALDALCAKRDWNHRTVKESALLFDALCPNHPAMNAREFWKAALRGGVQGMLYFADTILTGGRRVYL